MKSPTPQWGKLYQGKKVPPAEHVIAWAIHYRIGHAASEDEIITACATMREEGLHNFDLGSETNLRNRIQRQCVGYGIQPGFERKNYAPIFEKVDRHPVRWQLVKGFTP